MRKRFPLYTQHDAMDCGPTCLRMVAAYYGQRYSSQYLRKKCFISRQGVSLLGISEAAERIGLHTIGVQLPLERLVEDVSLPCIIHWNKAHFVVLCGFKGNKAYINDPAKGFMKVKMEDFENLNKYSNELNGLNERLREMV